MQYPLGTISCEEKASPCEFTSYMVPRIVTRPLHKEEGDPERETISRNEQADAWLESLRVTMSKARSKCYSSCVS